MNNNYGLNDEQYKAVMLKPNFNCSYVSASAGSGKTKCLIARIQLLLDSGVLPEKILCVTFTNKAAKEMKNRLANRDISKMQVSTIHGMCVKIINKFIAHTYLKSPFSIYDDGNQLSIIKTIAKARKLIGDPYDYLGKISRAKSENSEPEEKDTLLIYKKYQEILKQNNAVDFDDLQILAYNCLKHKDCRDFYSNLWQHLLIDEFQDTSDLQFLILTTIYNPLISKTFFAAGDQNQSIYGWRNAKPENVNKLIKDYKAEVHYLTYNYRSCPEVIAHANKFLQFGKPMIPKSNTLGKISFTQFLNQEDEANKIADALSKMDSIEDTAILFRVNSRSILFEKAFSQRKMPYKIVGALPYYKRKVVKDLLSYCKASLNRSDTESLIRIVNTPKRGFGEAKQELLLQKGWDYLEETAKEMSSIRYLITLLDDIKSKTPAEAVQEVLHRTEYRKMFDKENDLTMIDSFIDVASGFNSTDELILASTFLEEDSGHGVKLMSAHASKGLEFDRVFVVGVEEDLWPHSKASDILEENRLFYVACTRSKRYLSVSYSKSRLYRGQQIVVQPSNLFVNSIKELPK
jgi:DNA helicase-2/ATP-dependent DNA helicase PcrA